ncbi:hypothetical protein Tco_0863088, partial [Tanacetum coccineum]
PPGYYTKIDNRSPYAERRQSLEELLAKHQEKSAQISTEMEVEDFVWSKRYLEWYNKNSHDKKPRPRDYTFKEWVKLKKGHLDISKSVRKDLFRLWVIDKSTEALDPDKDPFGRCLDEYNWVCSLEAFTRLNSSIWATKWFKRLVAYAKCNRDSYKSELGDKELAGRQRYRFLPNFEY